MSWSKDRESVGGVLTWSQGTIEAVSSPIWWEEKRSGTSAGQSTFCGLGGGGRGTRHPGVVTACPLQGNGAPVLQLRDVASVAADRHVLGSRFSPEPAGKDPPRGHLDRVSETLGRGPRQDQWHFWSEGLSADKWRLCRPLFVVHCFHSNSRTVHLWSYHDGHVGPSDAAAFVDTWIAA